MLVQVTLANADEQQMAIFEHDGIVPGPDPCAIALAQARSLITAQVGYQWEYYEPDDLWVLYKPEEWVDYENPLEAARDYEHTMLLSAKIIEAGRFFDVS